MITFGPRYYFSICHFGQNGGVALFLKHMRIEKKSS